MHDHLNKAPPRLRTFCTDLPEQVESTIMAALTKDARRRPSAADFLALLENAYKETRPQEEPTPTPTYGGKQKQTTVVLFAEFSNQPAEPRANTMPIPVPPQGFVAISLTGEDPPKPQHLDTESDTAEEEEAPTVDLDVLQRQDTHDEPDESAHVLNHSALDQLQRLGLLNGSDVTPELIQVFRRDAEARILALRQAIDLQESALIERTAHSLKSSCGNLGAERLQILCQSLENASRQGRRHGLDRMLVRLEQELALFNRALDEYLSRAATSAAGSSLNPTVEASQG